MLKFVEIRLSLSFCEQKHQIKTILNSKGYLILLIPTFPDIKYMYKISSCTF